MGGCLSVEKKTKKQAVGGLTETGAKRQTLEIYQDDAFEAAGLMTGALECTSKVKMFLSCKGLQDKDWLSKSDPMAVLFELNKVTGKWKERGRTEVVGNSLDPQFVKELRVLYSFETIQEMKVGIFDADTGADNMKLDLAAQDFLGDAEFALPTLMTAPQQVMTYRLRERDGKPRKNGATVTVRVEEVAESHSSMKFHLSATGLMNSDVFGKSDPYLRISQAGEASTGGGYNWVPVFKTEVVKNNLNPKWAHFELNTLQLCNADFDRPLRLEVFDYDSNGSHDLLGAVETSARHLEQSYRAGHRQLTLNNPTAPAKSKGCINLDFIEVAPQPSFLQFIQGGTEIGFVVAIDFSASNGLPSNPSSLHYFDPRGHPNKYEAAIRGVGSVLEFYDSDQQFPALGFGGKLPGGSVQHCFSLTSAPDKPECEGVEDIIRNYKESLQRWTLSGPTCFEPIISRAAAHARTIPPGDGYLCLLILTDGVVTDMPYTKAAIIAASNLPLSILIVGVGDADFSAMHELDSDDRALTHQGVSASRDIVQFVEFNSVKDSGEALAQECLSELPAQFLKFMKEYKVLPKPPELTGPPPPLEPKV